MRYHAVDASSELFFANQTPVLNGNAMLAVINSRLSFTSVPMRRQNHSDVPLSTIWSAY